MNKLLNQPKDKSKYCPRCGQFTDGNLFVLIDHLAVHYRESMEEYLKRNKDNEKIKPYPIYGYCPDECMFLSVTEKDQTDKKEPHICTRYNKQIKHGIFHPHLPKLKECDL